MLLLPCGPQLLSRRRVNAATHLLPNIPITLSHPAPKASEHGMMSINRHHRHAPGALSDRSMAQRAAIKHRDHQSELLLVSPDLSRSCFSAPACFSISGTRRRLELMNQLLICASLSAASPHALAIPLTWVMARPVREQSICFSSSVG